MGFFWEKNKNFFSGWAFLFFSNLGWKFPQVTAFSTTCVEPANTNLSLYKPANKDLISNKPVDKNLIPNNPADKDELLVIVTNDNYLNTRAHSSNLSEAEFIRMMKVSLPAMKIKVMY